MPLSFKARPTYLYIFASKQEAKCQNRVCCLQVMKQLLPCLSCIREMYILMPTPAHSATHHNHQRTSQESHAPPAEVVTILYTERCSPSTPKA